MRNACCEMRPEYNKARRKARVTSIIKAYGDTTGVTFVNAAEYQDGHRFAAATTKGSSLKHAASIVTQNAEAAEDIALKRAMFEIFSFASVFPAGRTSLGMITSISAA